MKCDRCGQNEATVHWTEALSGFGAEGSAPKGVILERHLCDECRSEEMPGQQLPGDNELRFQCRCGRTIAWRFPGGGCAHATADYEFAGRAKTDIETCVCGVKFVAITPRWKCRVCGAEAVVQPREKGARGYLADHIYGARQAVEIRIRGILPD